MELGKHLSYCRSVSPGNGLFTYVDKNGVEKPLPVKTTYFVGQKTGYSDAYGNDFIPLSSVKPEDLAYGNIHQRDECLVPPDADIVICHFSVNFYAESLQPESCNISETWDTLVDFSKEYARRGGYDYLAQRYLTNILSGAWLWHNIKKVANLTIRIKSWEETELTLVGVKYKRHHKMLNMSQQEKHLFKQLTTEIVKGFTNHVEYVSFDVKAELKVDFYQEIYPSQAFIDKSHRGENSKVLKTTLLDNEQTVIFTKDKIGAGIRCIDDWYPNADYPLPVGAYAADRKRHTSYRHPNTGKDLFSLLRQLDTLLIKLKSMPDDIIGNSIPGEYHFIAANLLKGGQFQKSKDKDIE